MITNIGFKKLKVICIIGNNPEERVNMQPLYIDLTLGFDYSDCQLTDSLKSTLDYDAISKLFQEEANKTEFKLLETYALYMKNLLKSKYTLKGIYIKIGKPHALSAAAEAFVELKEGLI